MFDLFNKKNNVKNNVVAKENNKIRVTHENDLLKMEVLEDISFMEYLDSVEGNELGNIPMSVLVTEGYNYFTSTLIPQTVYAYNGDDNLYFVTDSEDKYKIIEYIKGQEYIDEFFLEVSKKNHTFRVVKSLHDLSMSTIKCISYPCVEEHMEEFALNRLEAFDILRNFIKRVGEVTQLDKIANVYDLYKYTNICDDKYFHPVGADDVISISKTFLDDPNDINEMNDLYFDIILNDTMEVIGRLTFTLYPNNFINLDGSIRYEGNVGYCIKPQYQSNHYATRALKLLVELIKKNTSGNDKDLYISTTEENINSQKVALNNGAVLCYEGVVPEDNKLNRHDGVKAVKIYKIKI